MKILLLIISFLTTGITIAQSSVLSDSTQSNYFFSQGAMLVNEGRLQDAKEYLIKALVYNPDHPKADAYLAYCFFKLSQFNEAIDYASSALKKDGSNLDALKVRAYSYVATGEWQKSIPELTHIISIDSSDFYPFLKRAVSYFELGDPQAALRDNQKALELNSEHHGVNGLNGALLYLKGDYDEALKFLDKAIKSGETSAFPFYYKGLIYYESGNIDACISNLTRALNESEGAPLLLKEQLEAKYYLSLAYFQIQAYEKSISFMEDVLGYDSSLVQGYYILGSSLIATKELDKATEVFEKSMILFPNEGILSMGLGDVRKSENNYVRAKAYYNEALEKGTSGLTDTLKFYSLLAESLSQTGDTVSALKSLDKAVEYYPESATVYQNRLTIYLQDKNKYKDETLRDLDKLTEMSSKEKAAYYLASKAIILSGFGQYENGMKAIDSAIASDPFPEYYAIRSLLRFHYEADKSKSQGKVSIDKSAQEEILKDIDTAMKSDHRKRDAYLLKTTLLIAMEKNEEACESANEAISLGATITGNHLKAICKGKEIREKDSLWEFNYELSTFNDRFH